MDMGRAVGRALAVSADAVSEPASAEDAKTDAAAPTAQATPVAVEVAQAPQPTVPSAAKAAGGDEPAEGEAAASKGKKGKKGKKGEKEPQEPVPMRWLWRLSSPEKLYYVSGLLGAAMTGLAMPAIGLLMAEFIVVFYNPDPADMRRKAVKWALIFMSMGVANAVGAVLR